METDQIIIQETIKKIKINKNNDYIEINIQDRENFDKLVETLKTFLNKINVMSEDLDFKNIEDICNYGENQLRIIYGEDIVKKIFGVDHPSIRSLSEFYVKLLKILSDFNEEYNKKTFDEIEQLYGEKYFKKAKIKEKIGH